MVGIQYYSYYSFLLGPGPFFRDYVWYVVSERVVLGEWYVDIIQDRPPYSLIPNHPSPSLGCQGPIINVELNAWKCWGPADRNGSFFHTTQRLAMLSFERGWYQNEVVSIVMTGQPALVQHPWKTNVYWHEGKPMAFISPDHKGPWLFLWPLGWAGWVKGWWTVLDWWQWRNLKKLFHEKLATPKY